LGYAADRSLLVLTLIHRLSAIVEEESDIEEPIQREASMPPQQLEFEDAILFSELDSMENVLSSGGQLKFTGDPGGPTLTHLRQSSAATELDFRLKPATVGLIDNDRFHLLVRLTGGGARKQLGLLQETLQQEVTAQNEPLQREYERDPYSLIKGKLRLMKLLRMSRRLQLTDQKPPRSLFFLKIHSTSC
jgi:hypothetical protein